jgi:hypothetical protein
MTNNEAKNKHCPFKFGANSELMEHAAFNYNCDTKNCMFWIETIKQFEDEEDSGICAYIAK